MKTNPQKTLCCFCQSFLLLFHLMWIQLFSIYLHFSPYILIWFSFFSPLSTTSTCLCTSARVVQAIATHCWSVWTLGRSMTSSQRRRAASRSCLERAHITHSTWSSSGWADKHLPISCFFNMLFLLWVSRISMYLARFSCIFPPSAMSLSVLTGVCVCMCILSFHLGYGGGGLMKAQLLCLNTCSPPDSWVALSLPRCVCFTLLLVLQYTKGFSKIQTTEHITHLVFFFFHQSRHCMI